MSTTTCRFCNNWTGDMVQYGVRHYAHHDCYLKAGKALSSLHAWQVGQFPFRILKAHGLLDEAEEIVRREEQKEKRHDQFMARVRT